VDHAAVVAIGLFVSAVPLALLLDVRPGRERQQALGAAGIVDLEPQVAACAIGVVGARLRDLESHGGIALRGQALARQARQRFRQERLDLVGRQRGHALLDPDGGADERSDGGSRRSARVLRGRLLDLLAGRLHVLRPFLERRAGAVLLEAAVADGHGGTAIAAHHAATHDAADDPPQDPGEDDGDDDGDRRVPGGAIDGRLHRVRQAEV
jgi:hypothetical protein